MSNKSKIIIFATFFITLILALIGFYYLYFLAPDSDQPPSPDIGSCPQKGECEFQDCETQKVYKDNCEFEIQEGFCCNGYNSPTDRCRKKDFCEGVDDTVCENAGEEFSTCDRCSIGKSSLVKVRQGDKGCEYDYGICKQDQECGTIPENETSNLTNDSKQCADDRKIGEEWQECCIGDDLGKSRTIRKNEDCSLIVVNPCVEDEECKIESEDPILNDPKITIQTNQNDPNATTQTPQIQDITPTNTPSAQENNATVKPLEDSNSRPTVTNTQNNTTSTPDKLTDQTITQPNSTVVPNNLTYPADHIESQPTLEITQTQSIPSQHQSTSSPTSFSENNLQPTLPTQPSADITQIQEEMDILPRTSMKFIHVTTILGGLILLSFGMYVGQNTRLRLQIEEKAIWFYYMIFPKSLNKNQARRTNKVFETKLELKSSKIKE